MGARGVVRRDHPVLCAGEPDILNGRLRPDRDGTHLHSRIGRSRVLSGVYQGIFCKTNSYREFNQYIILSWALPQKLIVGAVIWGPQKQFLVARIAKTSTHALRVHVRQERLEDRPRPA